MMEFFRGWRRKVGCMTLTMALAFMAVWFRSQSIADEFSDDTNDYWVVQTVGGYVVWWKERVDYTNFSGAIDGMGVNGLTWKKRTIHEADTELANIFGDSARSVLFGLESATSRHGPTLGSSGIVITRTLWKLPLLWLVLPVTLFSAFLLLTKPGKSNQKKNTEPIPEKVA